MIERRNPDPIDIDAIFESGTQVDKAVERAARQALRRHKALNQPIVVWRNGAPALIPPDQIEIKDQTNDVTDPIE